MKLWVFFFLNTHCWSLVCINFIHKWRDLQFNIDCKRTNFWATFQDNFICSQSYCQNTAERKSPKEIFFHVMSNKSTLYLLDHDDFNSILSTLFTVTLHIVGNKRDRVLLLDSGKGAWPFTSWYFWLSSLI